MLGSLLKHYFCDYMSSISGFKRFHNEVINMPRDDFSSMSLGKIRTIAGYLLLTENKIKKEGINYKETIEIINKELLNKNYPKYRDVEFEKKYFLYSDLDTHYEKEGRMFRHIMSLCTFFGLISNFSRQKKKFNYDKCKEYYYSEDDLLIPVARNNLIMFNISDNDFIKSLSGIELQEAANYRPAYAILKYIKEIGRPVTKFEISVLLGRVDRIQSENRILERALKIGRLLPGTQKEQIEVFFKNMNWMHKDSGHHFPYASSQEPYFKFNSFFIYLEHFDLINISNKTELITLSQYTEEILDDNVPYLIADLENLLDAVDVHDRKYLNDIILYQRYPELLKIAKNDPEFIQKMNFRSLKKKDKSKRTRNELIVELSKIKADYKCQYEQKLLFKMPNGKYYCEAHHIIEFSTENGPDITENIVVLGPLAHKIIHHGAKEEVENVYMQLIKNGALHADRFRKMATTYKCLTKEHVHILHQKKIITNSEKEELEELIAKN